MAIPPVFDPASDKDPQNCGILRSLPTRMGSLSGRIFHCILRCILALRYRLDVQGLNAIVDKADNRPLLILPSHSALIDPIIVYRLLLPLHPRALADERQVDKPIVRDLIKVLRPIIIPSMSRDGRGAGNAVREGLARAVEALQHGDNVLLYPAGRITRDGKDRVGGNSGAYNLHAALCPTGERPGCRVILVRIRGLWGSSFSMGDTSRPHIDSDAPSPLFFSVLLRGLRDLFYNALLFMPRRHVRILFQETIMPPAELGSLAFNRVLEDFYHAEDQPRVAVPRYFWQKSAAKALPDTPQDTCAVSDSLSPTDSLAASQLSLDPHSTHVALLQRAAQQEMLAHPELAAKILDIVRTESGMQDVTLDSRLSSDLGLDSLRLTGLALLLEEVGGHPVQRMDLLSTVGDCLLAAAGTLERYAPESPLPLPLPPESWHQGTNAPLTMPQGATVVDVFLRQFRTSPSRLALAAPTADTPTVLSRRDVLTRALALASWLKTDPRTKSEPRVAIMLPASAAATVIWLAALLAGKVPVMLNWTAGEANMRHGLRLTETRCVLTAQQLLQRLAQQGFDPARVGGEWIALEDVAASLGFKHKLSAVAGTALARAGLLTPSLKTLPATPETAVILFTSGSETLPKAVPLSHANVLANCRSVVAALELRENDTLLGMLPPFHSLGLTGNVVVALAMGMPVVFHPNPTESARLNEICRVWRPSVILSPPTFLESMLVRAESDARKRSALGVVTAQSPLTSLRVGFVGAEKCPESVYAAFAALTQQAKKAHDVKDTHADHSTHSAFSAHSAHDAKKGNDHESSILCEGYGVTECAPGVIVNRPSDARPGTIGVALPSVVTALVLPLEGPPERRAAQGETGMLLVRGPNVFDGYLLPPASYADAPSSVKTLVQPFVEFEGLRWYRSGDLVSADAGGHMTFRGRLGRFVKIGGEMISLPQMESALLTAFECRRDTVEGPLLAVECLTDIPSITPNLANSETQGISPNIAQGITLFSAVDITRDEANSALRAAGLPALCAVQAVRRVAAIPVLGSGKTDYRLLKTQ